MTQIKSSAQTASEAGIRLEPPPEPHHPEYGPFLQFARTHCCNFSASGPWGKRDYCWLEPRETNSFCVLPWGRHCPWFVEAVLPLNPELELAWHRLQGTAKADQKARWERECPDCGKVFVGISNRQSRCPKCAKKRRRDLERERLREYRANRAKKQY